MPDGWKSKARSSVLYSRVAQPQGCWHLGLNSSLLGDEGGAVLCTGGCLAVSLHSTLQTPVVPPPPNQKCVQTAANIPQKMFLKSHFKPPSLASLNIHASSAHSSQLWVLGHSHSLHKELHIPSSPHWSPWLHFLIISSSASGLLQYSTEGEPGTVRCLNMSRKAWRLQSHCGYKTDSWKAENKGSPGGSARFPASC